MRGCPSASALSSPSRCSARGVHLVTKLSRSVRTKLNSRREASTRSSTSPPGAAVAAGSPTVFASEKASVRPMGGDAASDKRRSDGLREVERLYRQALVEVQPVRVDPLRKDRRV